LPNGERGSREKDHQDLVDVGLLISRPYKNPVTFQTAAFTFV